MRVWVVEVKYLNREGWLPFACLAQGSRRHARAELKRLKQSSPFRGFRVREYVRVEKKP